MTGMDEFLKLFGDVTILHVVEIILAGVFLYMVWKKIRDHMIKVHEADKKHEEQLNEALNAVRKYPEYRQQSVEIQHELKNEIQSLRELQEGLAQHMIQLDNRMSKSEESAKIKERNRLEDKLLEHYRHYTNPDTNPSLSWTKMESDAFWRLFKDYEDVDGDGYMHSIVQPAMNKLTIIDVGH